MPTEGDTFWNEAIPEPNTGCLLWLGPCSVEGEPLVAWSGGELPARSVAWKLTTGRVAADIGVRCGSPLCINPAHFEEQDSAIADTDDLGATL